MDLILLERNLELTPAERMQQLEDALRLAWTPMTMAVELAAGGRGTLLVDLGVSRPDNWIAPHQTSVTPKVVREAVTAALAAGWDPSKPGTFEHQHQLILDRP